MPLDKFNIIESTVREGEQFVGRHRIESDGWLCAKPATRV